MAFNKKSASKAGSKSSRKGIPNKTNLELREKIREMIENNWGRLQNDIDELSPKERVNSMFRILEYSLPKFSRFEAENITSIEDILLLSLDDRKKRIIELREKLGLND